MYDLAVLEATFGVEEEAKPDGVGAASVPQPGSLTSLRDVSGV